MKKRLITLSFFITIITISCKKYSEIQSDVNDGLYIYGRLFIQDSINDNGNIKPLLKETSVVISYKNDPSKVLYTTKTSIDGYFSFLNLTKGVEYTVKAETETGTDSFKALFSSQTDTLLDETKNSLAPVLKFDYNKQNGVLYTIKDNLTNGLINGCNACFFSSQQLAAKDSCEYSLFSIPSNTNGMVLKTNLLPGRYYVLFKKQAGTLLLKSSDVIDITTSGIIRKEIKLF
jgi:hypothetical protein